jgi:hypothetical protein
MPDDITSGTTRLCQLRWPLRREQEVVAVQLGSRLCVAR